MYKPAVVVEVGDFSILEFPGLLKQNDLTLASCLALFVTRGYPWYDNPLLRKAAGKEVMQHRVLEFDASSLLRQASRQSAHGAVGACSTFGRLLQIVVVEGTPHDAGSICLVMRPVDGVLANNLAKQRVLIGPIPLARVVEKSRALFEPHVLELEERGSVSFRRVMVEA